MLKKLQSLPRKLLRFWPWFLHTSWKKKIAVIIVLLIVFIIIKNIFAGGQKQPYTFDTVTNGTVDQLVTENGSVTASNETDVYSPANGVLDQVFVKNGDQVNSGEKLFTVRSTATAQEQAVAYANYLAAESSLKAADATLYSLQSAMYANWKTYTDLSTNSTYQNDDDSPNTSNRTLPAFTTVQDNWLSTEAQYKNQQAVIAQSQASLNSASLAYQATQNATVTAPSSGVVANIVGLVGSKVQAETSSSQANSTTVVITPVMIIGTTNGSSIQTTVSEVDINKVTLGQISTITFSAIPGKTYKGHVIQMDSYGTNTNGVVDYNVYLSIDNADKLVKPGMSANLTINTAHKGNVLTVANASIIPYENGKAVQIVGKNGKVVFVPVLVGLRGFSRSEVLKGVTSGEKVILGNTQLTNNQSSGPGN